jgi:single stranded DNA-binding protein
MRGIETAFWGTLGSDPELKVSKNGKLFASFPVVVTVGQSDDGKDIGQWIRVACFSEVAEKFAGAAKKSDRCYVEGNLTMSSWTTATGETKTGLNVAAWRVDRLANIGKHRQFKEKGHEPALSSFKDGAERQLRGTAFAAESFRQPDGADYAPHTRARPKIQGLNDDLPF